ANAAVVDDVEKMITRGASCLFAISVNAQETTDLYTLSLHDALPIEEEGLRCHTAGMKKIITCIIKAMKMKIMNIIITITMTIVDMTTTIMAISNRSFSSH